MTTSANSPVGVFDSGLGGLSVVRQLWSELPRESLIYLADSRYCPYGERADQEIRERTIKLTGHLVDLGVKAIVVACNTASAAAIDTLRESCNLPIIAMEPAVKPAMTLTSTGKVAVLATPRTASGTRLARLITRYGGGIDVRAIGVPGLADLVERGEWEGDRVEALLQPIIAEQRADGVDVIVLGCTHYPFAGDAIRRLAGPKMRIVDSGNAVARRTRDQLLHHGLIRGIGDPASFTMWTTGDPRQVDPVASRLLEMPIRTGCLEL